MSKIKAYASLKDVCVGDHVVEFLAENNFCEGIGIVQKTENGKIFVYWKVQRENGRYQGEYYYQNLAKVRRIAYPEKELHFYDSFEDVEEGDRVKRLFDEDGREVIPITGTVIEVNEDDHPFVSVDWDEECNLLSELCDYSMLVKLPEKKLHLRKCLFCNANLTRQEKTYCNSCHVGFLKLKEKAK